MSDKYRPSNGTEGEWFMDRFCHRCKRDQTDETGMGGCEILLATMVFDVDESDYPNEWTRDDKGNPTCTAFDALEDCGGGR